MSLKAAGLHLEFEGHAVLRGVNIDLAPGELVGLIGPNGAGKSSLLRCLAGLVQPDGGTVVLDGVDVAALAPRARAKRIACLLQDAAVHWPLAVAEVVALGRHPHGDGAPDCPAVVAAMQRVDVCQLANQSIATLSGGERMRAHFARALAVEAPYFLADEPVASLDPYHQLECMELLAAEAAAGRGVAVVLHDLLLAARFCDRLVLLNAGEVVAEGQAQDVLSEAALREVYGVEALELELEGLHYVVPWQRSRS